MATWEEIQKRMQEKYQSGAKEAGGSTWEQMQLRVKTANENPYTYYINKYAFDAQGRLRNGVNSSLNAIGKIGTFLQPLAAPQQVLFGGIKAVEDLVTGRGGAEAWIDFQRGLSAAGSYATYGLGRDIPGLGKVLDKTFGKLQTDSRADSIMGYELLEPTKLPDFLSRPLSVAVDFLVDVPLVGQVAKAAKADKFGLNFSTINVLRNADGSVKMDQRTGAILRDMAQENIAESFTIRKADGSVDAAASWKAWSQFGRTVLSSPLSSAPIRDIFRAIPRGIREEWGQKVGSKLQDTVLAGRTLPEWLISDSGKVYGFPEMDMKKFLREGDFGGAGSTFLQYTKYRMQRLKSEVTTRGMFASKVYSDLTASLSDTAREDFNKLVKDTLDNSTPAGIIKAHAKLREFAVDSGIDPEKLYQSLRFIWSADIYNALAKNSLGKLSDRALTKYETGAELLQGLARGEKITYGDLSRVRRGMYQGTSDPKEFDKLVFDKFRRRDKTFEEEVTMPNGSKVTVKNNPMDFNNQPGGVPASVVNRVKQLDALGFSRKEVPEVLTHLMDGQKGWWSIEMYTNGALSKKELDIIKDLAKNDPNLSYSTYNGFDPNPQNPGQSPIPQIPVVMNMAVIKRRLRENASLSPVIEELAKKQKLTATTITKKLNELKKDPKDQAKMAEYHTLFGILGGVTRGGVEDFVQRFVFKQPGAPAGTYPQTMINGQYTFFDLPNAPWIKPSQKLQSYIEMVRKGAGEGVPVGQQYSKATIPVKAFQSARLTDPKKMPDEMIWSVEAMTHMMRAYRAFADPDAAIHKINRSAPARVTINKERLIDTFKRNGIGEEDAVVMVARIMNDREFRDPRTAPIDPVTGKKDFNYAQYAVQDPILVRNPMSLQGATRILNPKESTTYSDPDVHPADFMAMFLETQGYKQPQIQALLKDIGKEWHQNGITYQPPGEELAAQVREAVSGLKLNEGGAGNLLYGTNNSVFEGRQDLPEHWRAALDEIYDINHLIEEGAKRSAKQITRRTTVQEVYDYLKKEGVLLDTVELNRLTARLPGGQAKGWVTLDDSMITRLRGIDDQTGQSVDEWGDMPFKPGDTIPAPFFRFLTQETSTRPSNVGHALWKLLQARWAMNKIASPQGIARDLGTNFVLAEQMGINPQELMSGMADYITLHRAAFGGRKAADKGVPEVGYDGVLDTAAELNGVKYSEFLEYGDFTHSTMYYKDMQEQMQSTLDYLTSPAVRNENWLSGLVAKTVDVVRKVNESSSVAAKVWGYSGDLLGVGGTISKKLAETKGYLETVSKAGVYMALRKKGFDPEAAARHADEILFNYENQPYLVDVMRRLGISPFAAFSFMATGRFARTLYENPYNISRWYKLPQSLAASDKNESEVRQSYFAAPEYMKNSLWVALPDWSDRSTDDGKPQDMAHDSQGRRRFFNLGAILPESGNIAQAMWQSDPLAQWTPPVLGAIKAMIYGEGFGGMPVYSTGQGFVETAQQQPEEAVRGFLQQAYQYALVPWQPGSPTFDRMVKSIVASSYTEEEVAANPRLQGLLKLSRNGILAAPFDLNPINTNSITQEAPLDPTDAMLRFSGITIQPIQPDIEKAGAAINKLLGYSAKIAALRKQMGKAFGNTYDDPKAEQQVDKYYNGLIDDVVNEMNMYLAVLDPAVEAEMIKFPEYRALIEDLKSEFEQSQQKK